MTKKAGVGLIAAPSPIPTPRRMLRSGREKSHSTHSISTRLIWPWNSVVRTGSTNVHVTVVSAVTSNRYGVVRYPRMRRQTERDGTAVERQAVQNAPAAVPIDM